MASRWIAALLAAALLLTACGGGDDADVADTSDTPTATEADAPDEPTTAEEPTEGDDGVKDVPTIEPAAPTAPPAPPAPTAEPAPTTPPAPAAPSTPPPGQADAMDDLGGAMGGADDSQPPYSSYVTITDDTGAIQVDVPAEWGEVDGRPYTDEQGRQLFDVRIAPDLEGFLNTWDVPGLIITASREVAQTENEITLLDETVDAFSGVCTYLGREEYDDGLYTGHADVFDACGGTPTGYIILGAVPDSRAFVIRVQVQVVGERDLDALATALNSFLIVGDV